MYNVQLLLPVFVDLHSFINMCCVPTSCAMLHPLHVSLPTQTQMEIVSGEPGGMYDVVTNEPRCKPPNTPLGEGLYDPTAQPDEGGSDL